jgi:hypothetical protein
MWSGYRGARANNLAFIGQREWYQMKILVEKGLFSNKKSP